MFSSRLLLVLLLAAAEFGCQQKAEGPRPRYAIVRFENLSGDPTLDWTGRAASEVLSVTLASALDGAVLNTAAIGRQAGALGARPSDAPGLSTERAEALLAGATRLVSGYIERVNGKIRISAVEEEIGSGKSLRTVSAEDSTPFGAMQLLSHQFSPSAKPYLTKNPDVVHLYAAALENDLNHSDEDLEKAVHADPNFGPAWLALVRIHLLRGDRGGAEEAITAARANHPDPITAASLDSEEAQLKGDRAAAIEAGRRLSALSPGDTVLLRGLADREMADGQFAAAAADWKKLADTLVNDPATWNSLGYARSYAGDYPGALQAFQTYGKLRPADANVEDSIGDVAYSFRKFSEAAQHYQQAYEKDHDFLRGGDLYKAAWAKFNAGDKPGADALFAQFRAPRAKAEDRALPLIEADWLYRTGRVPEATALLRKAAQTGADSASFRAAARSQLAIWDLLAGDRAAAKQDAEASGPATTPPLVITRFAVLPSAPAAEWKARAEKMIPGAAMAPLQRTALAYALLLDGKDKDALPFWEEIVKSSPATDLFPRAILTLLKGAPPDRAIAPDPLTVNPFGALIEKLSARYIQSQRA